MKTDDRMREVTKEQFREMYFRYGNGITGWTQEYWDTFYEKEKNPPMRYMIRMPASPKHTRMIIVDDFAAKEYRMFFLTEDEEESFFGR
jgi:hypothetical protein